jgi:glutathione peroxidase-family protein
MHTMRAFVSAAPVFNRVASAASPVQCRKEHAVPKLLLSSFVGNTPAVLRPYLRTTQGNIVRRQPSVLKNVPAMSAVSSLTKLPALKDIDGVELSPSVFEGKVVLAVNVATACGYTNSGYKTMKELGEMFPDDLVVAAIPCNQFGRQENGTPSEIAAFARGKFAKLVITERTDVNGPNVHPIMAIGKAKFPGDVKVCRLLS